MSQAACCTCAALLAAVPRLSSSSEKPLPDDRQLDCCGRTICGACVQSNPRFLSYCPYCQTSGRSPRSRRRVSNGTRSSESEADSSSSSPPPYSAISPAIKAVDAPSSSSDPFSPPPPAYTPTPPSSPPVAPPPPPPPPTTPPRHYLQPAASQQPAPTTTTYVIHHLRHPPDPNPDTLTSLSLQYGLPPSVLRQHNNLPLGADYLLAARNTLLIPTTATTTNGPPSSSSSSPQQPLQSLSPHPVHSAAERERKVLIRRWQVACKEPDYDAAVVYLEASGFDFAEAVRRYRDDAAWERAHPLPLLRHHHPPQQQQQQRRWRWGQKGWGGGGSGGSGNRAVGGGGEGGEKAQ